MAMRPGGAITYWRLTFRKRPVAWTFSAIWPDRETGGAPYASQSTSITTATAFEVMSKRRKGYPSERRVKRGERVVHGNKELAEKLGRNDPCPCGSGLRFQALLLGRRPL